MLRLIRLFLDQLILHRRTVHRRPRSSTVVSVVAVDGSHTRASSRVPTLPLTTHHMLLLLGLLSYYHRIIILNIVHLHRRTFHRRPRSSTVVSVVGSVVSTTRPYPPSPSSPHATATLPSVVLSTSYYLKHRSPSLSFCPPSSTQQHRRARRLSRLGHSHHTLSAHLPVLRSLPIKQ